MSGLPLLQECLQEEIQRTRMPKKGKPHKYPIDDLMHQKIKKVYMGGTGKGQVNALAKELGYPRWKIQRYALHQGWTAKQKKDPPWSGAELEILKRWAHITPENIRGKLKAAGFTRSIAGIILKRKRLRLLSNLRGHTARSVALCLGEDVHFVLRAIRSGELKARKRETHRTEKQGGEIWFITDKNIRDFILENVHAIDFRKVDKYWYTDIVAGRALS